MYNFNNPGCSPCSTDTGVCSTPNSQFNVPYSTGPCTPDINGNYFPEQYLNAMAGNTMPLKKVFQDQFRGVADFLFNYEEVISDKTGKIELRPVFKSISNIQLGDAYDGNYFPWGEWYYKSPDFFITQDYAAPTKTIQVGKKNGMGYTPTLGSDYTTFGSGKLIVGDTIAIYRSNAWSGSGGCCEQFVEKTIVAVDPVNSTITIEDGFVGDTGFTFTQGDKVVFLFHGRNDCQVIDNTFGMTPSLSKRSYIQHFSYTIDFKKCDLNKAYSTPNGAQDFIANRIFNANINLVRQMIHAVYYGRNRGEVCNTNQDLPAETQGLITGIWDANQRNPELELVTSLANALTDSDKVRHILDEILKVQSSGLVNTGDVITLVCNQKALAALMKMNEAWNRFTGFTVYKTDNVTKDFTLPIIQTPNGRIEFKYDTILSERYPNSWVIIMGPKNLIGIKVRKNAMYNYVNNQMVASTLGITVKEVTEFKQHECRSFDVLTEFACIISGLDSGARRFITDISSC